MKNTIILLILLSCIYSCSSDKTKETMLHVSESEIILSAQENIKIIEILSNEVWSISETPEWISISPQAGDGDADIIVKILENPNEEERSVILTVTAKEKSQKMTITQLAKNVTLALSKSEIISEAEPINNENQLEFSIISNETWTITNIPEWCTLNLEKGNGDATVRITTLKNYIDTEREANIEVKAGSKIVELKVIQKALDIELRFANDNGYPPYKDVDVNTAYEEETKLSFSLISNTKWNVQSVNEWITLDQDKGENSVESITYSIQENKNKDERRGELTITAGSKSLRVLVIQGSKIETPNNNPYQINLRDNAPRIGDIYDKIIVDYKDPGEGGENKHWTFDQFVIHNNNYTVKNEGAWIMDEKYILGGGKHQYSIHKEPVNSFIIITENNTMYYHQIKNNQQQRIGHENVAIWLRYNPRMIMEQFPTYYKDSYKQEFTSDYLYNASRESGTEGTNEMIADGYGSLTLPSGTYTNVLRIKLTRIEKDLNPYFVDPNSALTEYTIHKWYAKGYRYPLFETHRIITIHDQEEIFAQSFYCPPQNQQNMDNKQNRLNSTYKAPTRKVISWLDYIFPIISY